jgi:hypothetical protein
MGLSPSPRSVAERGHFLATFSKILMAVGSVPRVRRSADIIEGYEVGKGQYLQLEPEELEAIAIESKRTMKSMNSCRALPDIHPGVEDACRGMAD